MKKYLNYILSGCAIVILSGCQKLDREFVTAITQSQIDQSISNVQYELNSIYGSIPDGTLYIGGAAMMASATDEAEFTLETNAVQSFNTGSWNAISNPDFVWGTYFNGIRNVNTFLVSTDNINLDPWKLDPSANGQSIYNTDLAMIQRWKYEARLLRAYFYFELIKRYGSVPLLNTSLSLNSDFSKVQRSTLDSCINFITSECDSAAGQLPLNANTAPYTATDIGRVTKITALALKSRVLLYAASDLFNTTSWAGGYAHPEYISLPTTVSRATRWKAASDAALAAITAAGPITLFNNYQTLFNNYNTQTVPEIIFTRTTAASNTFEKNNAPVGYPSANANANTPSQDLVDAYDVIVGSGSTATTTSFDWTNSAMAAAPYNNRDPRLKLTVIQNNTTFGTVTGRTNTVQLWTGGLDGKPVYNASKTGYYLRKFQVESLNLSNGNTSTHSFIIFRFPELYLNYAEALNEWSPGASDIKTYYDKVRSRTGVAMPGLPTGLSQDSVRQKIRNEDRVEFAFEDHRWWDVRRWMIAPNTLGGPFRGVNITKDPVSGAFTYSPFVVENRVFQPKMYLYPIPQTDLNIAGQLLQNPLW